MDVLNDIYAAIAAEGFTARTLQMIDNYAKDIQNGREDFSRFNLSEHAGLCKGGTPLMGRPSSHATRQQALQQVAMLKAAKEAQQTGK